MKHDIYSVIGILIIVIGGCIACDKICNTILRTDAYHYWERAETNYKEYRPTVSCITIYTNGGQFVTNTTIEVYATK